MPATNDVGAPAFLAAAQADPALWPVVGPFMAMEAPPAVLDNVADRARAVPRSGWRPSFADGPSGDDLAAALAEPTPACAAS